MIGLLAFVCLPFWMTGPVVGCAIGFLLGLRTWVNLTVVLAGTYLAIGGWALLLRELHARVAEYSVFGPMVLMALIVLIAVAAIRELVGFGKLYNFQVLPENYMGNGLVLLAPGAFIILGLLIWAQRSVTKYVED